MPDLLPEESKGIKSYFDQTTVFSVSGEKLHVIKLPEVFDSEYHPNLIKRAVLSSIGGNHALQLLDLETNKLITKILDKSEGPSISTITPDGKSAIVVGNILDTSLGFKIYKVSIQKDGAVSLSNSVLFNDGSIVLDVRITPDQNKVYILLLKENKKQLLILNMKDLSQVLLFIGGEGMVMYMFMIF